MDIQNVVATVAAVIVPQLDSTFATALSSQLDKATSSATDGMQKRLGASISNVGSTLTKNVTVPIVAAIGATIAAGTAVDGYYDTIQSKTGLTGEALAGLQQSFKNVGKTSSQDLGGIADTISILYQRLGVTGAPLEQLTKQIADLQQVTGVSADLDNLTRTLSAFNIPTEGASAALDKLFSASQQSGVEFNRLTSLAVTQSAAFGELGFTFDETIALLAQFEKSGVNTETVLAGLKASIVKSTKGTDLEKVQQKLVETQTKLGESTQDLAAKQAKYNESVAKYGGGTSQVLEAQAALTKAQNERNTLTAEAKTLQDQLNKSGVTGMSGAKAFFQDGVKQIEAYIAAGKNAEAQTLASEVFGAKTFADALDAIRRGQFNVDDFVKNLETSGGAIQKTATDTADYTESLAALRNQATIALGDIGTKLFPILTDAIQTILPPLVSLVEKFAALPEPVQKVAFGFAAFFAAAGPVLSITGKITSGLTGLSKVGPLVTKGLSGLSSGFSSLLAIPPIAWVAILGVVAVIAIVVLIVKNWDKIKEALAKAVEFMKKVWQGFVEGLKILITGALNFIRDNWKTILAIITGPVGIAVLLITKNWDTIKSLFSAGVGFISNLFGTVGNILLAPFRFFQTAVQSIIEAVKGFLKGLIDFADTALGPIDEILGKAASLVGSGIGAVGDFITGKAEGGPVMAGRPYVVGERGPELIVPRSAGTVIPNNVLAGASAGRGGANYTIEINNPTAEPSSTSIPKALRRAAQLRD